MNYEDYMRQYNELVNQELDNKRAHTKLMEDIERRHRENQCKELDLYHETRRKELSDYRDKQAEVGQKKRELKLRFQLDNPPINLQQNI